MIKRVLRATVRTSAFRAFVRAMEALGRPRAGHLHVLTYHRVDDPSASSDLLPQLLSATPEEFDAQMGWLAAARRAVALAAVIDSLDGGPPLPPGAVLITFDDAYEDFSTCAWPILTRHRLPATLFVATAYPDQARPAFWWDRVYRAIRDAAPHQTLAIAGSVLPLSSPSERVGALRAAVRHVKDLPHAEALAEADRICLDLGSAGFPARVLGWEELRRLASQGVAVAPHSRTHPLMNRMPLDDAVLEAVGSRRDIEREVGWAPPCFAYPAGGYSDELPSRLAREGFRIAFTTCRGVNDLRSADPLRLRRINVSRTTSLALLRAQLTAWMRLANRFIPITGSP